MKRDDLRTRVAKWLVKRDGFRPALLKTPRWLRVYLHQADRIIAIVKGK